MKKMVALNERRRRIGEDHPNAKLTDHEVELIRDLREHGMKYKTLAEKFEVSKSTIAMVCRYERRGELAHSWLGVHVSG
jgi:predicted DNA-binding protein (UPF0251 family)